MPAVHVDAFPVAEQGAALFEVDEVPFGVLVGDLLDAAGELVEAFVDAELCERGVVAVVDEAVGEIEVTHRSRPVQWREHPGEQHRAEPASQPVGEVVEVEQRGDLPLVVVVPEQLWDVLRLQSLVEIVGAAVRAGVKSQLTGGACPDRLADRAPQDALELRGHRAALAGQQRQPVGAVAPVSELTQRVGERFGVGKIGKRERLGQHRRQLSRMIVKPLSRPRCHRFVCGWPRVPVKQVAERQQVTQVDRRVEPRPGERRFRLSVEQRVNPALRRERGGARCRCIRDRELSAA
ncbi:MAG: hypothetical protein ACXVFQ_22070 [Solirubrobacteraceae bacterium]